MFKKSRKIFWFNIVLPNVLIFNVKSLNRKMHEKPNVVLYYLNGLVLNSDFHVFIDIPLSSSKMYLHFKSMILTNNLSLNAKLRHFGMVYN